MLEEHDFECPDCGSDLSLEDELGLVCYICDNPVDASSLEEAACYIDDECGYCSHNEWYECSLRVEGSHRYWKSTYEWAGKHVDTGPLKRLNREDYWEGLIHFCTKEEFCSILNDRTIHANPTGLCKLPVVCLSEATSSGWPELQKRHGECGFLFRKRDIILAGGGPILNVTQWMLRAQKGSNGFAPEIRPFLQLLRLPSAPSKNDKFDYLHEREWRLPKDINLGQIELLGVIVSEPMTTEMYEAAVCFGQLKP